MMTDDQRRTYKRDWLHNRMTSDPEWAATQRAEGRRRYWERRQRELDYREEHRDELEAQAAARAAASAVHNRAKRKEWYELNRDRIVEERRARYLADPEFFRERSRQSRRRTGDPERNREYQRRYRAAHPESNSWYQRHRDLALRSQRERDERLATAFVPLATARGKRWTADEERVLLARAENTDLELAAILHRTPAAVHAKLHELRHGADAVLAKSARAARRNRELKKQFRPLAARSRMPYSAEENRLIAEGGSAQGLARLLGRTPSSILAQRYRLAHKEIEG